MVDNIQDDAREACEASRSLIHIVLNKSRERFLKQKVKLVGAPGEAKDRIACIDGIIADEKHGLLFCCMVYKNDDPEKGFLNDPGWSRSYRPLHEFIFVKWRPDEPDPA